MMESIEIVEIYISLNKIGNIYDKKDFYAGNIITGYKGRFLFNDNIYIIKLDITDDGLLPTTISIYIDVDSYYDKPNIKIQFNIPNNISDGNISETDEIVDLYELQQYETKEFILNFINKLLYDYLLELPSYYKLININYPEMNNKMMTYMQSL